MLAELGVQPAFSWGSAGVQLGELPNADRLMVLGPRISPRQAPSQTRPLRRVPFRIL